MVRVVSAFEPYVAGVVKVLRTSIRNWSRYHHTSLLYLLIVTTTLPANASYSRVIRPPAAAPQSRRCRSGSPSTTGMALCHPLAGWRWLALLCKARPQHHHIVNNRDPTGQDTKSPTIDIGSPSVHHRNDIRVADLRALTWSTHTGRGPTSCNLSTSKHHITQHRDRVCLVRRENPSADL